jgi:dTDP-4-dehydrorhamnose reductase
VSARWLVFGAAGQLGRSFLAVAEGLRVDAHASAVRIDDPAGVEREIRRVAPQVVLNCAAFTKVDLCESRPDDAERANATGAGVAADACASAGALLVHLSTDYVFRGDACVPIPEDAPTDPQSVYGKTKLAGEGAVRASGADHLVVRTQWVFGPGANFVRTILAAAARGEPLSVVEDQLGRPTWSGALARAILGAVEAGARGTLHLACEGIASWCDFARAIVGEGARRGLSPLVPVRAIATRELVRPAARPAYGVLSLERARKLGLELPHWQQALADYLDCEREKRDA